jgi:hypothetical protein
LDNKVGAVVVHVVVVILDKLRRSDIVLGRQPVALRVRGGRIARAGRRIRLDAQHLVGGEGAVTCGRISRCVTQSALCSGKKKARIASRILTAYSGIQRLDGSLAQAEIRGEGVAGFTLPSGEQDN